MRGLIYKDLQVFLKSIDKRLIPIAIAAVIILLFKAGPYAGLLAAVMLAMTIGMQHIMTFISDEKAEWKKYQLAMPVSSFHVVGGKYIAILLTVCIGAGVNVVLSLIFAIAAGNFSITLFVLSLLASIVIPVIYTAICLPLCYWFGFHSAQIMGLVGIIPIFYLIKYFEDGDGLYLPGEPLFTSIIVSCVTAAIAFLLSYAVSVLGYRRKSSL